MPGARAQAIPDTTTPVIFKTMGQPPHWKPYFGAFVGVNNLTTTDMATNVGGLGLVGIYRDLINPLVGVGVAAEGYGGYIGEEVDGGRAARPRAAGGLPAGRGRLLLR